MKSLRVVLYSLGIILVVILSVYLKWLWPKSYPILQGITDSQSTQFSVVIKNNEQVDCFINELSSGAQSDLKSRQQTVFHYGQSGWRVHKCYFSGLNLDKQYELKIKNQQGKTLEKRKFGLLNPLQQQSKIAIYSCANDWYHIPRMWQNLKSLQPDLIFAVGDNVYADSDLFFDKSIKMSVEMIYERYVRTWRTLELYQFDPLIPVVGLWDDHDYGANNSGANFVFKNESKEIFQAFFAQNIENSAFQNGPGVSSALQVFGVQFIFLDSRFFRDVPSLTEGSYYSKEQVQWAQNILSKAQGPVWILSGNQFYSKPPAEEAFDFEFPQGHKSFMEKLKASGKNIFLVSGDAHFTEFKKIPGEDLGYTTYELTSSGIHSLPLGVLNPDPRRLAGTRQPNFVLVKFQTNKPQDLQIEAYGLMKDPIFIERVTFGKP